MAEWSLAVPIRLCPLINFHVYSHFVHAYLFLIAYKMLLERAAQPQLVGRIKDITRGLISRLYNCTAIDRFGYANFLQSAH